MLGRRGFLKAIGAGVLGLAVALKTPNLEAKKNDIAMRFVSEWNAAQLDDASRFDVLCGYATVRPDFACRVMGA